jgi:hypothetical protein
MKITVGPSWDGDVHCIDLQGRHYDVAGTPGATYNYVSVPGEFQANGRHGKGRLPFFGTWMTELGLVTQGDHIRFGLKKAPTIVSATGGLTAMIPDQPHTLYDGVTAVWTKPKAHGVDLGLSCLTVRSPSALLFASSVPGGVVVPRHLSGRTKLVSGNLHPESHGLVGQLLSPTRAERHGAAAFRAGDTGPAAQGGGVLETIAPDGSPILSGRGDTGAIAHYRTSGLLHTDDDFSVLHAVRPTVSLRQVA